MSSEVIYLKLKTSQNSARDEANRQAAKKIQNRGLESTVIISNDRYNSCAFLSLGLIDKLFENNKVDKLTTANSKKNLSSIYQRCLSHIEKQYFLRERMTF